MTTPTLHNQLLTSTLHFLEWNHERIVTCIGQLREDQLWQRPNGNSNSVGNQLLHLEGNLRQWVVHALGGAPDLRTRQSEFDARGGPHSRELLQLFAEVVTDCQRVIQGLTEQDLLRERPVQAYVHDGTFILVHITEHLSYHTGQIVFWTKALLDRDLDLYAGDALNTTN